MSSVGVLISVAILWFLITLFNRSTSFSQSLTETWIVVLGMLIVGMLTEWLLEDLLGPLTFLVNVAALYFLVDKVCGTSRGVTIRICAWYFGLSLLINLFFRLIASLGWHMAKVVFLVALIVLGAQGLCF